MRRLFTLLVFIVVFASGITFSAINNTPVTVNYYLGAISLPLSVVVVIAVVLGIIIGALTIFIGTLHLRYENRRLHKKEALLEQEINNLRILPLVDEN